MKCGKCKTEIPDDAEFCYHCGYEVLKKEEPVPKKSLPVKPLVITAVVLLALIVIWRIAF
ncbi:MAG: zinc ribbon domain-containing protein [Spirochaetales bacterium]|jgi:predicted nucleic acid-binding Zn ribbon protein|nr:zinc ribbon domain-containing protein [Spirochaetales bacterium]